MECWNYALRIALSWRERFGLSEPKSAGEADLWDRVRKNLSRLPVGEGIYLAHVNCPQTYTERNREHPSMLGALGVLSGAMVDKEAMRRTLKRVLRDWRWPIPGDGTIP
jgi:hypothetical protein